jgi:polyhydroxyalkanoate synthesis repressor PhaR
MADAAITIKKYANRRLYNMATSAYVTLEDVAAMVRAGDEFRVEDARSGEDITRQVLTQIIVEAESGGSALLPVPFLRELIRSYGQGVPGMLPSWLELSMREFARSQEDWAKVLAAPATGTSQPGAGFALPDLPGLMARSMQQNMELMTSTLRAFGALPGYGMATPPPAKPSQGPANPPSAPALQEDIAALRAQMQAMQESLDRLAP